MKLSRKLLMLLAVLLSFSLIAAACGDDDDDADAGDDDMADDDMADGSLGVVTVEAGAEIQIRSLNVITTADAGLGIPIERAVDLAVADYGDINGFSVSTGTGLDDLCSTEGGQAAAQTIVADEQIVGVIGTSCSSAATAAAPLISEAGIVMVSASNTAAALTSDLAGNEGSDHHAGYYRTAHNDNYQGAAMAEFVFNELGNTTAAAIHDGTAYSQGLAQAFTDAFVDLGGESTGFVGIAPDDSDMVPALTGLATASPEVLYMPVFVAAGTLLADQAPTVPGLEDTQLIGADGILTDAFMETPQSEGMYFSGPDLRFGTNVNESTGVSPEDFLEAYEAAHGEAPTAPFWGHSYDATALLLDAISAASRVEGDALMIDRAGVREFLDGVSGYSGIIGTISCDEFGDCGAAKITIILHESADDIAASKDNVVFEFAP